MRASMHGAVACRAESSGSVIRLPVPQDASPYCKGQVESDIEARLPTAEQTCAWTVLCPWLKP